jgi:hypothetical protein
MTVLSGCAYGCVPCTCQTQTQTDCTSWPCAWKFTSPFDGITYILREQGVDAWLDKTGKWSLIYNAAPPVSYTLSDGTNKYLMAGPVQNCCNPITLTNIAGNPNPASITVMPLDCGCSKPKPACTCAYATFLCPASNWPCQWRLTYGSSTITLSQTGTDTWKDSQALYILQYTQGATNVLLTTPQGQYSVAKSNWSCCGPNTLQRTSGNGPATATVTGIDCSCVPPCVSPQISGLFNTGVDANGNVLGDCKDDPHWTGYVTVNNGGYPGWNVAADNSRWISTICSGAEQGVGPFLFSTNFNVAANADLSKLQISAQFMCDDGFPPDPDGYIDVVLNGDQVISQLSGSYSFYSTFTVTSGFATGQNSLQVRVYNAKKTAMGLRVKWYPFCLTAPPNFLARAVTFGKALIAHARDRFSRTTPWERAQRKAICGRCPLFRANESRCGLCGCKGGGLLLDMWAMRSKHCPDKPPKW